MTNAINTHSDFSCAPPEKRRASPYPAGSPLDVLWVRRQQTQDELDRANASISQLNVDIMTLEDLNKRRAGRIVELDAAIKLLTGEVAP